MLVNMTYNTTQLYNFNCLAKSYVDSVKSNKKSS